MTRLRASTLALTLALVLAVSGCSSLERIFAGPSTGEPLIGTSWSGTDSDGDDWTFEFQGDGTVAFSLGEGEFDDSTDTWVVTEETVVITIVFTTGTGRLVGPYSDGATTIDLDGEQGDLTWTLTIEQD